MKQIFAKFSDTFKKIRSLSWSPEKREQIFWDELKAYFKASDYNFLIHEDEKYIEAQFYISDSKIAKYCYFVCDGKFLCRVVVVFEDVEYHETNALVLATHLNNNGTFGKVLVIVAKKIVEYRYVCDLRLMALDIVAIHQAVYMHFTAAEKVYWAYEKLLIEYEAPAIIFADLIKRCQNEDSIATERANSEGAK